MRVEIAQSRSEQNEYLRNVELARIVNKRNEKRKEKGLEPLEPKLKRVAEREEVHQVKKRPKVADDKRDAQLQNVLGCIF